MKIITLDQITEVLPTIDLLKEIATGFVAYSQGRAQIPPVGEMVFDSPPGDVHIKYGYLKGDDYYVVKIASGFYENAKLNLPSSNGLMLLFNQNTGELVAILLDEGYLTDVRTAVAGALAAKYLAPTTVTRIGIAGTGTQARLQLAFLATVSDCRDALVWGRDTARVDSYQSEMSALGFDVHAARAPSELLSMCNLVITTTPATSPLLEWPEEGVSGIHITAIGSDTSHKQELDTRILQKADLVVADSISQCETRGEIHHALATGAVAKDTLVELGDIISSAHAGRSSDSQVTVADLTGVAVQDIQIAKAVYEGLSNARQS